MYQTRVPVRSFQLMDEVLAMVRSLGICFNSSNVLLEAKCSSTTLSLSTHASAHSLPAKETNLGAVAPQVRPIQPMLSALAQLLLVKGRRIHLRQCLERPIGHRRVALTLERLRQMKSVPLAVYQPRTTAQRTKSPRPWFAPKGIEEPANVMTVRALRPTYSR